MDIVLTIDDESGAVTVNGQPAQDIKQALQQVVSLAQEAMAVNPGSEETAMMESFPKEQAVAPEEMPPTAPQM